MGLGEKSHPIFSILYKMKENIQYIGKDNRYGIRIKYFPHFNEKLELTSFHGCNCFISGFMFEMDTHHA